MHVAELYSAMVCRLNRETSISCPCCLSPSIENLRPHRNGWCLGKAIYGTNPPTYDKGRHRTFLLTQGSLRSWPGQARKTQRAARIGLHSQTGEAIKIKAKTTVKFRLAKTAKDALGGSLG